MEQQVKEIISGFLKLPPHQIQADTVIDRSALASSILVHRMYAALAAKGIKVDNYWDIKTFGTLLQTLGGNNLQRSSATTDLDKANFEQPGDQPEKGSVGIDIEEIDLLPSAADYREHEFYIMNFSPAEIAYCILQPSPKASFAGLFAAKEAIVKADNSYLKTRFNKIIIGHLPGGKPIHPQFFLSISHTNNTAVAIAMRHPKVTKPLSIQSSASQNSSFLYFLALTSLALSVLTILFLLFFK